MRLFIALPLPRPLFDALALIQQSSFPARWQNNAQMHLTLAFLGELNETQAAVVDDALSSICAPPLRVTLAGVGHFAKAGRAHSLWAGIAPHEPVAALSAKITSACRRAGIAVEARRFVPHITVARLRTDVQSVAPWLMTHGGLTSAPAMINCFSLFQSHLDPTGSQYTALADYALR